LAADPVRLIECVGIEGDPKWVPRYNIAPSQEVLLDHQ